MNQILKEAIGAMPVIDTHEHLPGFEADRPDNDVLDEYLSSYLYVQMKSAGMRQEEWDTIHDHSLPLAQRWSVFEPWWQYSVNTGYGRALRISAEEIYGIPFDGKTIEELNEAYRETFHEKHYHKVLREKCRIELGIVDVTNREVDRTFFVPSHRIDHLIWPAYGRDFSVLEKNTGIRISRFENYLQACEKQLDQYAAGSHILKLGIAYTRTLDFPLTSYHEAETDFNRMLSGIRYGVDLRDERPVCCGNHFTDYVLRFLLDLAQQKHMIVQVHTGMQDRSDNVVFNSHPRNLNTLLIDYPDLHFDLFHIGYPYQHEFTAICQMFPNVTANMCWAHILSPVAARGVLSEWLEMLPYNKISAFGGDYMFVDAVPGHLEITKNNLAEVLSGKMESSLLSLSDSIKIAQALLYDNPVRIYELDRYM